MKTTEKKICEHSGRKTKAWKKILPKLKKEFMAKDITSCELRLDGCWINNALGFAHRHKRDWYNTEPDLLGSFDQVILSCNPCHQKIEYDSDLTKEVFEKLRDSVV